MDKRLEKYVKDVIEESKRVLKIFDTTINGSSFNDIKISDKNNNNFILDNNGFFVGESLKIAFPELYLGNYEILLKQDDISINYKKNYFKESSPLYQASEVKISKEYPDNELLQVSIKTSPAKNCLGTDIRIDSISHQRLVNWGYIEAVHYKDTTMISLDGGYIYETSSATLDEINDLNNTIASIIDYNTDDTPNKNTYDLKIAIKKSFQIIASDLDELKTKRKNELAEKNQTKTLTIIR